MMLAQDPITRPEQLEADRRYHVWYLLPSRDVFIKFDADKRGLFLRFVNQPPVEWLHVTMIRRA